MLRVPPSDRCLECSTEDHSLQGLVLLLVVDVAGPDGRGGTSYNSPGKEEGLSHKIDLEVTRRQLEEKRRELLVGVSRAREMGAVETESSAPDIADRATNAFQREFSFSLSENEGTLLKLIEGALKRLDGGKFGRCSHCDQPIEEPRLKAIPWASYCISCQELQDRGEL